MGLFSFGNKKDQNPRAAEQKKIRRVNRGQKDPYGLKEVRRNEERAALYRRSGWGG